MSWGLIDFMISMSIDVRGFSLVSVIFVKLGNYHFNHQLSYLLTGKPGFQTKIVRAAAVYDKYAHKICA